MTTRDYMLMEEHNARNAALLGRDPGPLSAGAQFAYDDTRRNMDKPYKIEISKPTMGLDLGDRCNNQESQYSLNNPIRLQKKEFSVLDLYK